MFVRRTVSAPAAPSPSRFGGRPLQSPLDGVRWQRAAVCFARHPHLPRPGCSGVRFPRDRDGCVQGAHACMTLPLGTPNPTTPATSSRPQAHHPHSRPTTPTQSRSRAVGSRKLPTRTTVLFLSASALGSHTACTASRSWSTSQQRQQMDSDALCNLCLGVSVHVCCFRARLPQEAPSACPVRTSWRRRLEGCRCCRWTRPLAVPSQPRWPASMDSSTTSSSKMQSACVLYCSAMHRVLVHWYRLHQLHARVTCSCGRVPCVHGEEALPCFWWLIDDGNPCGVHDTVCKRPK